MLAQEDVVPMMRGKLGSIRSGAGSMRQVNDSSKNGFEQRDDLKDSITITYRYLDSTRRNLIDSSINDYDKYHSVPSGYINIGNNGLAAYPIIFKPYTKLGIDPGLHAFDVYKFTLDETKIYRTTRPFSMLGYAIAAGKEQVLQAMHTQNPRQNINWGFDYRLITAPGLFPTQNTNHKSYRLYGNYAGKRKRYNGTIVLVGNNLRASENGGIQNPDDLKNPNKQKRFSVPVNLGDGNTFTNPFNTAVKTGNLYKDFTFFLRQSYDVGKKDSVAINDSTTEYLFYPKLRFQHSFSFSKNTYIFNDGFADSVLYKTWFNITLPKSKASISIPETWNTVANDFSLIQFPDTKNSSEFLLAGATLENIKRTDSAASNTFFNIKLHGEYRNRTRNRLWDMLLKGEFYSAGYNIGEYSAYATLSRYLNKKLGNVSVFFTNVNRTPSFVFDSRSAFSVSNNINAKKENILSFGATATNPFFELKFANHFINNYAYCISYTKQDQFTKPVNILQVSGSKRLKIYKNISLFSEATLQQATANSPISIPLFYTRNRLMYEGKPYKNLNLATGFEVKYNTPFRANNYSPVTGQFFRQDTATIKNLPDVHFFLHFRIKALSGFFRVENLNTFSVIDGKVGFMNNNFAAPLYPTPGMMMKFGIRWWFVN